MTGGGEKAAGCDPSRFRRDVRRAAALFVGQRLTHAECVAAMKKAAGDAGILASRRKTRADRILTSLAWGAGALNPGELPARLEPSFAAYERGDATAEEFAGTARGLLEQLKRQTQPSS